MMRRMATHAELHPRGSQAGRLGRAFARHRRHHGGWSLFDMTSVSCSMPLDDVLCNAL